MIYQRRQRCLENAILTETDFLRAICNEFDKKPEACSNIPEPIKVNVIVLNDKRCDECDVTQLMASLKAVFPGLNVKNLDYSSQEGKSLFESLGLQLLPVLLFDEGVKEDPNYAKVQQYLEQKGTYYSLRIGATFNPNAEICDNNIDDNKNGKIDCDDDDCASEWKCMEKKTVPEVELFVMSHKQECYTLFHLL